MRKMVNVLGGVLLLGVAGYYVFSFATADGRVRKFCGEMHAGMSVEELNRYAERVGLGPPARATGVSFLVENKTFGRYGCRVESADGAVKTVAFDASN